MRLSAWPNGRKAHVQVRSIKELAAEFGVNPRSLQGLMATCDGPAAVAITGAKRTKYYCYTSMKLWWTNLKEAKCQA